MREYRDYNRYDFNSSSTSPKKKWWKILIIANMVVFGIQLLVFLFFKGTGYEKFLEFTGLNVQMVLEKLWLWQLFSYMFLHDIQSVFHLLFNMLALYFFAPEIEMRLGSKRFLFVYFSGGVAAGVAYVTIYAFTSTHSTVLGASGAIMGILALYACYWPTRTVIFFVFPMKIRTLVLLLIGIDLYYSMMSRGSGVAHVAHLGGALFGYLFYRYEGWFIGFLEGGGHFSLSPFAEKEELDSESFEKRLDKILEKVHREGMTTLTKKERKFLKDASKKYKEQE